MARGLRLSTTGYFQAGSADLFQRLLVTLQFRFRAAAHLQVSLASRIQAHFFCATAHVHECMHLCLCVYACVLVCMHVYVHACMRAYSAMGVGLGLRVLIFSSKFSLFSFFTF